MARVEAEINSYLQLFEGAVVAVQAGTFNPQPTEPWMPGQNFLGFSQPQAPTTFQSNQLSDLFNRAAAWFQAEKIMLAPFVEKFRALQPSSDLSFLKEFTNTFKQKHAATMPGIRKIIDDFETMCGIKRNG